MNSERLRLQGQGRLLLLGLVLCFAPAALAAEKGADAASASALDPDMNLGTQPATSAFAPAAGSTAGAAGAVSEEVPRSFGKELIQFVLVLALVLGLIYLTLNFGLRRLMSLQRAAWGRSELVSVVERIPLEGRACMYVVKAGSDHLLLGRTEHGMSLLHTLSAEDVERVRREKPPPQLSPFLQKLLSRRRGPPPTA